MMHLNLADSESEEEDARMEGGSYGSLTRQEQSRFTIKEKLGEGAYGKVYKAYDNKLRSIVALKVIRIEHADEGIPSTALREIGLLRELAHGGIVQLLDVITSSQKLTLVFEYFHVDLKKQLDKRRKPYTIQQTRSILWQTMNAL